MRSTHRLFAAVAAIAFATAAGAPRPAAAQEVERAESHWARLAEPLDGGVLRFELDRPAYVAVFSVTPGEGIRLLYPATAAQNALVPAGARQRLARRGFSRRPALVALDAGEPPQPRTLFLVASSRRLKLDEPLSWPDGALAHAASFGGRPLDPRTMDVEHTLEVLFDLVVLDVETARVDTDAFTYFPDVRYRRGGRVYALTAYQCADGRLAYVPADYDRPGTGSGYDGSWFGVDFARQQYVGVDCFANYSNYYPLGGFGYPYYVGPGRPPAPPADSGRAGGWARPRERPGALPATRGARDARPSIPVQGAALRDAPGEPPRTGAAVIGRVPRVSPRPAGEPQVIYGSPIGSSGRRAVPATADPTAPTAVYDPRVITSAPPRPAAPPPQAVPPRTESFLRVPRSPVAPPTAVSPAPPPAASPAPTVALPVAPPPTAQPSPPPRWR